LAQDADRVALGRPSVRALQQGSCAPSGVEIVRRAGRLQEWMEAALNAVGILVPLHAAQSRLLVHPQQGLMIHSAMSAVRQGQTFAKVENLAFVVDPRATARTGAP
jgi:hypothetical protein